MHRYRALPTWYIEHCWFSKDESQEHIKHISSHQLLFIPYWRYQPFMGQFIYSLHVSLSLSIYIYIYTCIYVCVCVYGHELFHHFACKWRGVDFNSVRPAVHTWLITKLVMLPLKFLVVRSIFCLTLYKSMWCHSQLSMGFRKYMRDFRHCHFEAENEFEYVPCILFAISYIA